MSASTLFEETGCSVYTVPRSAYTPRTNYDSSLILHNVTSCASNLSDTDLQTLNMQVKRLERKRYTPQRVKDWVTFS